MKMSVELISIGSELLSGRTVNTHAQTLGAALTPLGIQLVRDTTIPDSMELIHSTMREAFERSDIVVISGGLGSTSDDITREALAGLFQCRIVMSAAALDEMTRRYRDRGRVVTEAATRQTLILEGAQTLLNAVGAAPGQMFFPAPGKVLFVVPGPPAEFFAVLHDHIIPWLRLTFPAAIPLELRVLTTQGIGESDVVTRLEGAQFKTSVDLGFYPGFGQVEIRLTAPRSQVAELDDAERTLRELLRDHLLD